MKLYYSKGACSLAPHIILHEIDKPFTLEPVNLSSKHYRGGDYWQINPKGGVPLLELEDGKRLTEAAVILQYLADQAPSMNLLPTTGTWQRYQALEWLNYIATELHKGFGPLWKPTTPDNYKVQVLEQLKQRFTYLQDRMGDYLMSEYSVADAYLYTVLNWTNFLKMDLKPWPKLVEFMARISQRPAVIKALTAEGLNR